jgi:hypothetical protein
MSRIQDSAFPRLSRCRCARAAQQPLWIRAIKKLSLVYIFYLHCPAASSLDLVSAEDLGLRAQTSALRGAAPTEIQAAGESELRAPLKSLGVLLECLLVARFRAEGFLGPAQSAPFSPAELGQLPQWHLQGQAQMGEGLYALYPWTRLFPFLGISTQVTWERAPGSQSLFDARRVFMNARDSLILARALNASPCGELEVKGLERASAAEARLLLNEEGTFIAWTPRAFYAGASLKRSRGASELLQALLAEDAAGVQR